ncbi:MAG: ABC transporter ATP-binding protein [Gammaproteobacteria bacterium]|nr:ABC transporter ATP-binding protein [Gammaproteobacteria bacterium]MCP5136796.1 ABC transporter ATP-binding protein [Gammaproteobacteria bacterium]
MALIEIHDLTRCFGSGNACAWALNGIDLEIERAAWCVLEGRSGSGKTTLLNIIGTLDSPTSGSLRVAGTELGGLAAPERNGFRLRHLGFVFQAYNLMAVLDARENVAYPLQLRGWKRDAALARADEWLARVGLDGLTHRRPHELSGGQQQRVAVARALAGEPDLILADEPTANLDSHTAGSLIELMQSLNQDIGTTFVIASHDPAVIASTDGPNGHRVTLQDGKVAASECK